MSVRVHAMHADRRYQI